MLDIIFFAAIAAFIGFRLYNALGHKNFEPDKIVTTQAQPSNDKKAVDANFTIVPSPEDISLDEKFGKELADNIREIKKIEPSFTPEAFISGAKKAFEIILKSFSAGNKEALQPLLSQEVYNNFAGDIDNRVHLQQLEDTTLVAILAADIKNIVFNKKYVRIAVQIVSEQINLIRDKQGKIVSGNPSEVNKIEELWVFGRELGLANPNWQLLETASV